MARPLGVKSSRYYTFRREGYFFDYVKQELIKEYGADKVRRGGLSVTTTLDLKLQRAARAAMVGKLGAPDRAAAIVSIDPRNGYIRAMASSVRYGDLKFNLAAQGHRQPGSTFKTMVLMTALRRGVDPKATTYTSQPLDFNDPTYGPIKVKTYSNSYIGRANLVQATLKSDNSIYEQLDLDLGPDQVRQTAYDMGIKTRLNAYPAEGLGGLERGVSPLEMADAYATIASGGWRNRAKAVTRVCFKATGKCDDLSKPHRTRAFEDGVTAEATDILRKNIQGGTGTKANINCPAGGKTGTTDNFTDAWFVGFTPHLSTSTWVGHANSRVPMPGVAGGTIPATIWHDYMTVAKGKFCGDFAKPKVPFQAAPFFGKYAKTGVRGNRGSTTGNPAPPPVTPQSAPPATSTPGGTTYDPNAYESPPQPAPGATATPGNGKGNNGNGKGNGAGGATP
jgi:penicillin-binding protein 1A